MKVTSSESQNVLHVHVLQLHALLTSQPCGHLSQVLQWLHCVQGKVIHRYLRLSCIPKYTLL